MLSYSKFENIQKRKLRTFWLRCSLSNCFWNLLIMTQNASPDLLCRKVPVLTKAADEFCSLLGGSKRRSTARSSRPRRLRAGRAGLAGLWCFKSLRSLSLGPASSLASSCPPNRVYSPPGRRRHSLAHEGDQLGVMTPVCVCLLPAASLPEHTFFLSLFFLFFPEENQVHLLRSEV